MISVAAKWTLACVLFASAHAAQTEDRACQPIAPKRLDYFISSPTDFLRIDKPGNYCLTADMTRSEAGGEATSPIPMVIIGSSDVVLDLNGHTITSKYWGTTGIEVQQQQPGVPLKKITIRNGRIELPGDDAIVLSKYWRHHHWPLDDVPPVVPMKYEPANILLENLHIKTKGPPIRLEGSGNIVRNCRIDAGERGTSVFFGNDVQLINNEFVVTLSSKYPYPAAIWLRDADNGVLIGNTIRVSKSFGFFRTFGIVLKNSEKVRIEHNTIEGATHAVTLLHSTAEQKNNAISTIPALWPF